MDAQRFDVITDSLARGLTRRRAMKAVLGAAAGGSVALLGRHQQSFAAGRAKTAECCRVRTNGPQAMESCMRCPCGFQDESGTPCGTCGRSCRL